MGNKYIERDREKYPLTDLCIALPKMEKLEETAPRKLLEASSILFGGLLMDQLKLG